MWAPDARRGFLAGPSPSHVHAIADAEELLEALPDLLHRGELAAAVQELPVADLQGAIRPADADLVAERVFRVYAFLAHAYLRAVAESAAHVGPPPLVLPKSLSVPWAWAAARSHRYPSLDYASSVLANCVHVAADAPVQPDLARDVDAAMASRRPCVRALTTFTGTADERHFYEVHARVEIEAAPAIGAMAELLESAGKLAPTSGKLAASTARALTTTAQSVRRMAAHLPTMTRGCRPSFFYSELRPYLGAPGRPVLFDGVGEARGEPPLYVAMRGASGAQSAVREPRASPRPCHRAQWRLPRSHAIRARAFGATQACAHLPYLAGAPMRRRSPRHFTPRRRRAELLSRLGVHRTVTEQ